MLYFFLFQLNCIFSFQIPFWYIWEWYKFDLCITGGEEDLVYNYFFTSQRESVSVSDMKCFDILLFILLHSELPGIELPKLTSSILKKIVTILVSLIYRFYFYIHQPIKTWVFEKKIVFEIDYHWSSLSLHFHIVLKSLVSY